MTGKEAGDGHKNGRSDLDKRRAGALWLARVGSLYGFLFAFWAIIGLERLLKRLESAGWAHFDASAYYIPALVRLAVSEPEISPVARTAFLIGAVAEIVVIVILSWRIFSGRSFLSAILLFALFAAEVAAKYLTGPVDLNAATIFLSMAVLLGLPVYYTWLYQRLTREMGREGAD